MKTPLPSLLLLAAAVALAAGCVPAPGVTDLLPGDVRRTPAEWEPQAAVWLQWPQAGF